MFCRWLLPAFLVVAGFGYIGYYVGWFAGASRTPTIDTLVPLLIALLCGLSYGLLDKKGLLEKLTGKPEDEKHVEGANPQTSRAAEHKNVCLWPAVLWVFAVAIFTGFCAKGSLAGYQLRSPVYQTVSGIVGPDKLTPVEYARATSVLLRLRALGMSPDQVQTFAKETIGQTIADAASKEADPAKQKLSIDSDIKNIWEAVKQLDIPTSANGLGPGFPKSE